MKVFISTREFVFVSPTSQIDVGTRLFLGLATNLLTLKATKKAWLENGSCRKYHRLRAQLLFCVNLHFIFMQFGFRDSWNISKFTHVAHQFVNISERTAPRRTLILQVENTQFYTSKAIKI